jgi:hypothetical protein
VVHWSTLARRLDLGASGSDWPRKASFAPFAAFAPFASGVRCPRRPSSRLCPGLFLALVRMNVQAVKLPIATSMRSVSMREVRNSLPSGAAYRPVSALTMSLTWAKIAPTTSPNK